MSEEDLELLITIDDPRYAQEEDTFNHLQVNNLEYWLGQQFPNGNMIDRPNKKLDIEVCTVTRWKNGTIVEQKVFYDLVGMQKHIGVM